MVIWLTGLPSSGKSTLCNLLKEKLNQHNLNSYVLDGDILRKGICSDLGFSKKDRDENIRRVGEIAKILVDSGIIVLAAFISPYQEQRDKIKNLIGKDRFFEIYCKCPLEICKQRDVKGHYKKAELGIIKEFTGVSSPYEEPKNPDLIIDTSDMIDNCLNKIFRLIL